MAAGAAAIELGIFDDQPMQYPRIRSNDMSDGLLFRTTRLNRELFNSLLAELTPILQRRTKRNNAIPVDTQLLVALGFYASGGFQWLAARHTMCQSTACKIIRAVTDALVALAPREIQFPLTPDKQAQVKREFYNISQFPNVLGAIDGTHIHIRRPPRERQEQYVNRHQRFSMNVMAICDANQKFTNIYADFPGSNHDAHIWGQSQILAMFQNRTIVDGWLLGDSAYPLQPWMMTPLGNPISEAQQGYQRAHTKTRCTIERSFGLLKSRFRCLDDSGGILSYSPRRVCLITVACCVLHNLCCDAGLEQEVDEGVAQRIAVNGANLVRVIPPAEAAAVIQRRLINGRAWLPA